MVGHTEKKKDVDSGRKGQREDGHRSAKRRHHRSGRDRKAHDEIFLNGHSEPFVAAWNSTEPSFVLDVKGDPGNLTYGSIHRYVVPSHHRFGAGSVIGLTPDNKIDRYTSNEQVVFTSANRHDEFRKRDKTSFAKVERKGEKTIRVKRDPEVNPPFGANTDFLPFRRATGRKRKCESSGHRSDSSSSSSDTIHHYRSIEGKAKRSDRPDDRDLVYASDASGTESEDGRSLALDESVRLRSIALSRRVDAEPTNADAWLDLINHQDALLGLGQKSLRSRITNAERLSTADVKLSIYERALQQVKNPHQRERMILGMMDEGAKVWETKKTFSKWRAVLEADPSYFSLWQKYLDFRQTDFITFRYEEARTVYSDCLSMLKKASSVPTGKATTGSTLYELQMYVLLRMTLFMREAGYSEHAVGIWQAFLEYTFYRPSQYEIPIGSNLAPEAVGASFLSSFRDFWESEVPRIGEEGAKGWSTYAAKGGDPPPSKQDKGGQSIDENNVFESWSTCEHERALSSRWPARTIDDVEEDDPYRVILFSDVQDFLELIDPPSPAESGVILAAFLAFSHLPPLSSWDRNSSSVDRWWKDSFIRNDNLYSSNSFFSGWNACNSDHREEGMDSQGNLAQTRSAGFAFRCPLPYFTPSVETLFASGSWFAAFSAWESSGDIEPGPLDPEWVRSVLRMLVKTEIGGDSLAEYYLAFELAQYPKEAKKTAKSLLKQRSSSLRLYNAYALIEYRLHNTVNAQKVLITAINMSKGLDPSAQRDTILLWRTWMWELLDSGQIQEALQRLLTVADGTIGEEIVGINDGPRGAAHQTANSAALLRARRVSIPDSLLSQDMLTTIQALTDGRDQTLSSNSPSHALLYSECLLLLTYLTTPSPIPATLTSFQQTPSLLSSHPSLLEPLHQSLARLLHHHTTHTPSCPPSLLRHSLTQSIALFPNNTIFLSLYAANERRFRIHDRVRSIVSDLLHSSPHAESVITWSFALQNELHRGVVLGSNVHAIRATFERAVASQTGKASACLWKWYVLWEAGRGGAKRAKGVYWRAVRACPWVKEVGMLAFGGVGERLGLGMGREELRGVVEGMGGREVRVHAGLEEVFAGWDEGRRGGGVCSGEDG